MEIADDQALKVGDAELLRYRTVDDSNPYFVGRESHKRYMAVQQRCARTLSAPGTAIACACSQRSWNCWRIRPNCQPSSHSTGKAPGT